MALITEHTRPIELSTTNILASVAREGAGSDFQPTENVRQDASDLVDRARLRLDAITNG